MASKDVVVMEARGGRRKEVRRDDVTEKFGKFEIKQELECWFFVFVCFV